MNSFFQFAAMAAVLTAPVSNTSTCRVGQKQACYRGKPCTNMDITGWARIDPDAKTYSRCDPKGCDSYPAQFSKSGVWTNVAMPEHGMLARYTTWGDFLEVVTLNDAVLVSYGKCR